MALIRKFFHLHDGAFTVVLERSLQDFEDLERKIKK
jgi:hypothetical protein